MKISTIIEDIMRKRKPADELTPEQIARRERNDRYRAKKMNVTPIDTPAMREHRVEKQTPQVTQKPPVQTTDRTESVVIADTASEWAALSKLWESPTLLFPVVVASGITGLMVHFQTSAYATSSVSDIALPLSIVCETCLVALPVMFACTRSKISAVLFAAMFAYTLGVMSFDLKTSRNAEISNVTASDSTRTSITRSIEQAQSALELARSRGESGNVSKNLAVISSLTSQLTSLPQPTQSIALAESKYSGLMFLRAILMLINAYLVHWIVRRFKNAE